METIGIIGNIYEYNNGKGNGNYRDYIDLEKLLRYRIQTKGITRPESRQQDTAQKGVLPVTA